MEQSSQPGVFVRMVDGTICRVRVPARQNPDGTYHLLDNPDFDPEDTSTLLEFLPGDDVRATTRVRPKTSEAVLVGVELARSSVEDRDYWSVLFAVAWGDPAPSLANDRLRAIAARVNQESQSGARWHYPSVVEWAKSVQ